MRNVHSLKYQMQESRVIMRILYGEQRPALIVLSSFPPFTLLQQLELSFCRLMPSLRVFAHAPPSAQQFFLSDIHTVISSSSLRSHLSITSSNMTFLPISTKIWNFLIPIFDYCLFSPLECKFHECRTPCILLLVYCSASTQEAINSHLSIPSYNR